MSLFFGAYCKNEIPDMAGAISDFSLSGQRKLIEYSYEDLRIFYTVDCIIGNTDEYFIVVSGPMEELSSDKVWKSLITNNYEYLSKAHSAFTFLAYDKMKRIVYLGNDCFGLYPLFVYEDGCLVFSNEFQPILKLPGFEPKLDTDALAEFFGLGAVIGSKTFFLGVENLPPASILKFSQDQNTKKIYDPMNIKVKKGPMPFHAARILRTLKKATKLRVEPGAVCDLSGGADTRLMFSMIDKGLRKKVIFETFHTLPLSPETDRDVLISNIISKEYGFNHRIVPTRINEFNEEYFELMRPRDTHPHQLKCIMGGEYLGGDYLDFMPVNVEKITESGIKRRLDAVLGKNVAFRDPVGSCRQYYGQFSSDNKRMHFAIEQLSRSFFSSTYLQHDSFMIPYTFLTKSDSIFLDLQFLRTLLTIPEPYLKNYRLYGYIYTRCLKEYTDIPSNSVLVKKRGVFPSYESGLDRKEISLDRAKKIRRVILNSKRTWHKGIYNQQGLMTSQPFISKISSKLKENFSIPEIMAGTFSFWPLTRLRSGINNHAENGIQSRKLVEQLVDFETFHRVYFK